MLFLSKYKTTQMVTNQQTNVPVNQFQLYDNVAMEIENIFNPLIEQLITRRDTLLTKLQTMKEDFVTKETTRKATIEELGRVIKQMQEESMKLTRMMTNKLQPWKI